MLPEPHIFYVPLGRISHEIMGVIPVQTAEYNVMLLQQYRRANAE